MRPLSTLPTPIPLGKNRLAGEERIALVSVLQELTAAVFALFDPEYPIDLYLERVAARLGCRVILCLEARADGSALELLGAAGLSRASREGAKVVPGPEAMETGPLPFPEVNGRQLVRWVLPIPRPDRHGAPERWLMLFFAQQIPGLALGHGASRRLAEYLGVALEHRALLALALERERHLDRLNGELERRVAERTRELAKSLQEIQDTQRQLAQAAKLAAVGQLAGGVAHEINNPLAAVLANVDYALERISDRSVPPEVVAALRDAREGAERARVVVRDLKTFARPDEERTDELVDVGEALRTSLAMARNEIRHRARLRVDLEEVTPVAGSAHRLGQVLLNLLVNAAQAIPEGRLDDNEIRVRVWAPDVGHVAVEVADTGSGIPTEVLPRIFDPYFTTKPLGVGTGLGLSICHRIVTSLGGEIQVESRLGVGSTFRVLLHAASHPDAATRPPRRGPATAAPDGGHVLVVDDDPLVGQAMARALSPPHRVSVVESAEAALDLLATGRRFDVVLSDLMMPGMDGIEFHARALKAEPRLGGRFVFVTGGAFTQQATDFARSAPGAILEKPVQAARLRDAIGEVMSRRDATA